MLLNSDMLQSPPGLTSVLQQLKIVSLSELCSYDTKFIIEHFDEEQLNTLNKALRYSLWQAKLLPAKMEDLNQQHLPLEVLGLAPHMQANLVRDSIETVSEFIQHDTKNGLTAQWSIHDRLAVRTRILCLLALSTEQLDRLRLSDTSNSSRVSVNTADLPKVSREQIKSVQRFRTTLAATCKTTDPSYDKFEDCPFLHKPWLRGWLPDDFNPAYPEIVKFLFQDVYQLPIASSRRHELWAGAQIKATGRLREITNDTEPIPQQVFAKVYKQFDTTWQHLEILCTNSELPLPHWVLWASEILSVRKDFYNTPRSRLRHFVKTIENSNSDENTKREIINAALDSFELLWMLPNSTLKFMQGREQELTNVLPSFEEFKESWERDNDLQHDLEILQKQGVIARNNLISGYFRSVLRFARNYVEKEENLDYLDFVQEGAIGLILAADKFDYRSSARFITYATSWMWQTTERIISEQGRNIRIPVHRYEQFRRLEKVYREYVLNDLEVPGPEILCLQLELLDKDEVDRIQQHLNNRVFLTPKIFERWSKATKSTQRLLEYIEPTLSMSTEIPSELIKDNFILENTDDSAYSLSEVIYGQQIQLDDKSIITEDLQEFISDLCDELPTRTQLIISLRFGLRDREEQTLEEIGQQLGLTRERVRQLEKKAFEHLGKRGSTKKRKLEEYLALLEEHEPPHWPSTLRHKYT
jgi:RNA polymerase sigma factor (sigma-70 family)